MPRVNPQMVLIASYSEDSWNTFSHLMLQNPEINAYLWTCNLITLIYKTTYVQEKSTKQMNLMASPVDKSLKVITATIQSILKWKLYEDKVASIYECFGKNIDFLVDSKQFWTCSSCHLKFSMPDRWKSNFVSKFFRTVGLTSLLKCCW